MTTEGDAFKRKLAMLPRLHLEELSEGSDTSKSKDSHVDADSASGTVIVVALGGIRTIGGLTTVSTLVGVLVVERTLALAINNLVLLQVIKVLAELLDIGG